MTIQQVQLYPFTENGGELAEAVYECLLEAIVLGDGDDR